VLFLQNPAIGVRWKISIGWQGKLRPHTAGDFNGCQGAAGNICLQSTLGSLQSGQPGRQRKQPAEHLSSKISRHPTEKTSGRFFNRL
jgi:hypothetical protein